MCISVEFLLCSSIILVECVPYSRSELFRSQLERILRSSRHTYWLDLRPHCVRPIFLDSMTITPGRRWKLHGDGPVSCVSKLKQHDDMAYANANRIPPPPFVPSAVLIPRPANSWLTSSHPSLSRRTAFLAVVAQSSSLLLCSSLVILAADVRPRTPLPLASSLKGPRVPCQASHLH